MLIRMRSRSRPFAAALVLGILLPLVIITPALACTPPDVPFNLDMTSTFAIGTGARAVAADASYVYVGDATGLSIYDRSAVTPVLLSSTPLGRPTVDIVVSGSRAFVLTDDFMVHIVDVSVPAAPVSAGNVVLEHTAYRLAVSGNRLFVAAGAGLRIFDVTNPASPIEATGWTSAAPVRDVVIVGDFAYVATHDTGTAPLTYETPQYETIVHAINVAGATPVYLSSHTIPYGVPSLDASADGTVLFAVASSGDWSYIKIFDITNPEYLAFVTALDAGTGGGLDVAASGQSAYLAGAQDTRVYDAAEPELTYMSAFHPDGSTRVCTTADGAYVVTLDGAVRALTFTGTSERAFGATRYDTAVDVSKQFASATHVVIATGGNYPDALAGAPLAYKMGAPLLLAGPAGLSEAALAEVKRLGATNAVILGGTGAVPEAVRSQLTAAGMPAGNIVRIAGADRYDTSRLIALKLQAVSGGGSVPLAFVATGANFPDALAAAGVAAKMGAPILLVKGDAVPPATASAMGALGVADTVVLGLEGAISSGVAAQLPSPERLGGADRFGTAASVAAWAVDTSGSGFLAQDLVVATGDNFPDALASGAFAATIDAPTLLVSEDVPASTSTFIAARKASVQKLYVIGGTSAVSTNVERVLVGLLN